MSHTHRLMDPSDSLTWQHDWSDVLADGETIASRQWTADPDSSPSVLSSATSEAVTVARLVLGFAYRISEEITTSAGNVHERSITIRCEHR